MGFKGALNWAPMMSQNASLSDNYTRYRCCFIVWFEMVPSYLKKFFKITKCFISRIAKWFQKKNIQRCKKKIYIRCSNRWRNPIRNSYPLNTAFNWFAPTDGCIVYRGIQMSFARGIWICIVTPEKCDKYIADEYWYRKKYIHIYICLRDYFSSFDIMLLHL